MATSAALKQTHHSWDVAFKLETNLKKIHNTPCSSFGPSHFSLYHEGKANKSIGTFSTLLGTFLSKIHKLILYIFHLPCTCRSQLHIIKVLFSLVATTDFSRFIGPFLLLDPKASVGSKQHRSPLTHQVLSDYKTGASVDAHQGEMG